MKATVTEIKKQKDKVIVYATYSDGVESVQMKYPLDYATDDSIKSLLRREAARLERLKNEPITLSGEIDLTEKQDPALDPTPFEVARKVWLDDWELLQKYKRLVDHGIMKSTDPKISTLASDLNVKWDDRYLSDIS